MAHLSFVEGSVQFWIGDWIRYGEKNYKGIDSKEYDKAVAEVGLERKTLQNIKYVSENISPSRRREGLSFTHHAEVAHLDPEDQKLWLEEAEKKELSVRELRKQINQYNIPRTALPNGRYSVILADPPWRYDYSESCLEQLVNPYKPISTLLGRGTRFTEGSNNKR